MISLKAYNREIEQLIDNGLYDDAIAHSIHILSSYPKCIDAYRNLGKSLLEQKKYPEASDVFSRVLSAIPDDFISHVGLSIIFEDQANLDLAIWHMEQAFDVQPSNLAVQDELKRLFGLRDGEQPTKIRLTRGALVRMYARGELFQQAITEILSILEEDPRRIDLEVILARMHYFSGAIEEADADCNRILEKIPFCFEANRILYQININKKNSEAATINMNRLISLDPYYQFVSSTFSEEEIPENKVMLEKLDYIPSKIIESQIPEWLEDFDLETSGKSRESLNLFKTLSKNEESISASNQEIDKNVVNNSIQSDDDLPEWIKNAGINAESEYLINETNEVLSDNPSDEKMPKLTADDLASLFSELKEGKMSDQNESTNGNDEKQNPPSDWMSQFSNSDDAVTSNPSDQDFPDWLKNFQEEEPLNAQESDNMPEWLKNLQPESEPISQPSDGASIIAQSEENVLEETTFNDIFLPSDNAVISDEASTNDDKPQEISEQDDQWEKIDLLNTEIEEPLKSTRETEETESIPSDDKIPDWVKTVLIEQNPTDQSPVIPELEPDQMAMSSPEEESQSTIAPQEIEANDSYSEEGIISQQTNDELLDWLRGLKTEEGSSTQNANSLDSSEISSIVSNENDQDLKFNDLHAENVAITNEFVTDKVNNQDLNGNLEEEKEQVPFESNTIDGQSVDQNQSVDTEVEYTEYANELTETPSNVDSLEELSNDEINELVIKQDFGTLSDKVGNLSKQNQGLESLLSKLTSSETQNRDNFAYWQCLGDVYSKNNQLNEALLAYQNAEDILVTTISS